MHAPPGLLQLPPLLLLRGEMPVPDSLLGQVFQMSNYLSGTFSASIILSQVVYL